MLRGKISLPKSVASGLALSRCEQGVAIEQVDAHAGQVLPAMALMPRRSIHSAGVMHGAELSGVCGFSMKPITRPVSSSRTMPKPRRLLVAGPAGRRW